MFCCLENSLVGLVWKKRFYVLRDNLLSWYSKEKRIGGAKPKGVIYCEKSRLYELSAEEAKREFCFQVDDGKVKHNIAAESAEEMKSWMTEIRVAKKKKLGVQVVSDAGKGPLSPRGQASPRDSPRGKKK